MDFLFHDGEAWYLNRKKMKRLINDVSNCGRGYYQQKAVMRRYWELKGPPPPDYEAVNPETGRFYFEVRYCKKCLMYHVPDMGGKLRYCQCEAQKFYRVTKSMVQAPNKITQRRLKGIYEEQRAYYAQQKGAPGEGELAAAKK